MIDICRRITENATILGRQGGMMVINPPVFCKKMTFSIFII